MNTFKIFVDAACDIDPATRERYDIGFVPLPYLVDDVEHICTGDEDDAFKAAFYAAEKKGAVPKTAAPSPKVYVDLFTPILETGQSILLLSLSSALSATCDAALIAKEELDARFSEAKLVVVDTLSASAGQAMLAEEAALMRADGATIDEVAAWLNENKLKQQHWFMVDDLMYLRRGGRVSGATAIVGTALKIKPILKIAADGTLDQFEKKRGAKQGMKQLLDYARTYQEPTRAQHYYVAHCANPEGAEFLRAGMQEIFPDATISVVQLLPFIGSHVGPGFVAVFNWGPEAAR